MLGAAATVPARRCGWEFPQSLALQPESWLCLVKLAGLAGTSGKARSDASTAPRKHHRKHAHKAGQGALVGPGSRSRTQSCLDCRRQNRSQGRRPPPSASSMPRPLLARSQVRPVFARGHPPWTTSRQERTGVAPNVCGALRSSCRSCPSFCATLQRTRQRCCQRTCSSQRRRHEAQFHAAHRVLLPLCQGQRRQRRR